jgi:predicted MFS family arabinose efflux permease
MRWRRESAIDLYNLLFGVFLFASPWVFAYVSEKVRFDVWITGAAVVAVSIAAIVAFSDWEEWFNLVLGVWLIASPWVLGFTHTRPMHVCIGIGIMVAFIAALELWLSKYDPTYASHPFNPQRSSDPEN